MKHIDDESFDEDEDLDDEEDGYGNCPVCRTELSPTPNGRFLHCDICGYSERRVGEEP